MPEGPSGSPENELEKRSQEAWMGRDFFETLMMLLFQYFQALSGGGRRKGLQDGVQGSKI